VVFVNLCPSKVRLQLVFQVADLVHEKNIVAEAFDDRVDIHQLIDAQLLLQVLTDPLNR